MGERVRREETKDEPIEENRSIVSVSTLQELVSSFLSLELLSSYTCTFSSSKSFTDGAYGSLLEEERNEMRERIRRQKEIILCARQLVLRYHLFFLPFRPFSLHTYTSGSLTYSFPQDSFCARDSIMPTVERDKKHEEHVREEKREEPRDER